MNNKIYFKTLDNIILNYFDTDKGDFFIVNTDTLNLFNNDTTIKIIMPNNCMVSTYYRKIVNNEFKQQLYKYYPNYNYNKLSYIPKTINDMEIYNIYVKILPIQQANNESFFPFS